jgi:hypothetical protein
MKKAGGRRKMFVTRKKYVKLNLQLLSYFSSPCFDVKIIFISEAVRHERAISKAGR